MGAAHDRRRSPDHRSRDRDADRHHDRPRSRQREDDRERHRDRDVDRDRERQRHSHRDGERPESHHSRHRDDRRDRHEDRGDDRRRRDDRRDDRPDRGGDARPDKRSRHDRSRSPEDRRDRAADRTRDRDAGRGRDRHADSLPMPPPPPPAAREGRANRFADTGPAAAAPNGKDGWEAQPEETPLVPPPAGAGLAATPGPVGEPADAPEPEPDFGLSGALAAETNRVNGVVLLHSEPPEAAVPRQRWRLYQFKGGKPFETPLPIHRQSCYLFGRERRVVDVPTDHPSCSKQQAVIQFRSTEKADADGMLVAAVRPYLMDLGSTNGTFLNGERIEAQRFYELLEQDMVKFGNSSREYVLLHENSAV